MRVEIYDSGLFRAHRIAVALSNGFANIKRKEKRRIDYAVIQSKYWRDVPRADVCIMYGLPEQNRPIWQRHIEAGITTVLVDMGYVGRLHGAGRYSGYHRFSVNAFHPEKYVMDLKVDGKRWRMFRNELPMREHWGNPTGKYVLIAGMHGKSYSLWNLEPEAWEQEMAYRVKKATDAPILYRPKPSWKEAKGLLGARLNAGPLDSVLNNTKFIISHHSNMGIEAMAHGIPFYQAAGIAAPYSCPIDQIETPPERTIEERQDLLNRVAYSQYSIAEMESGEAWLTLERIGAVPTWD